MAKPIKITENIYTQYMELIYDYGARTTKSIANELKISIDEAEQTLLLLQTVGEITKFSIGEDNVWELQEALLQPQKPDDDEDLKIKKTLYQLYREGKLQYSVSEEGFVKWSRVQEYADELKSRIKS
jgi:hypothetical protein